MAEPKLNAIFVRLTRDFPQGQQHTRGGVTLGVGPRPVSVEVTDEQLASLEADRYIEIVDDKEAKKWEDRLGEEPTKTSAEVAEDAEGGKGGRNYGDGSKDGSGDDDEDEVPATAEQLTNDNTRDALVELANEAGVEGLDFEDKQATTKKVIAEAIVAKRAETSEEE